MGNHERTVAKAVLGGGAIELSLRAGGGPEVVSVETPAHGELDLILREVDAIARTEAPFSAPALDPDAARWGLRQLTSLCLGLVDRDSDREDVASLLEAAHDADGADPMSPPHIWSVDLCMRYLPCLETQVRAFASGDPVHEQLRRLCFHWPLSGVGTRCEDASEASLRATREHPTLGAMLTDRLIAQS